MDEEKIHDTSRKERPDSLRRNRNHDELVPSNAESETVGDCFPRSEEKRVKVTTEAGAAPLQTGRDFKGKTRIKRDRQRNQHN